MKQYIDKDALVAELNRLIVELVEEGEDTMFEQGRISAFEDVKVFINSLEVKEVDLEKEYERYYEQERNIQTFKLAKHFFEIGLNSQRKINYVPNIDDILKKEGINLDSKEAKIFKESYYTALEKLKAQKGE